MTEIRYAKSTFAKNRGSYILIHEGLREFPNLCMCIIDHEIGHEVQRNALQEAVYEVKTSWHILGLDLFKFFFKHPAALFYALSPLSYEEVEEELYYDPFLLAFWIGFVGFFCVLGAVILLW
jgi:hypothetical protein